MRCCDIMGYLMASNNNNRIEYEYIMGYIMGCITLYNQRDMSFWFGACFSFTRNWLIKRKNKNNHPKW
jgi:endo-1,4-beta-D-glucanase Y